MHSCSARHSTENQLSSVLFHESTRSHRIQSVICTHLSPFSRSSSRKCRMHPSSSRRMLSYSQCDTHALTGQYGNRIECISRPDVRLPVAGVSSFRAGEYWVSSSSYQSLQVWTHACASSSIIVVRNTSYLRLCSRTHHQFRDHCISRVPHCRGCTRYCRHVVEAISSSFFEESILYAPQPVSCRRIVT